MDKPKDILRNQLETSILSLELDIKTMRKRMVVTDSKDLTPEQGQALALQIEQLDASKQFLEEKLKILNMEK